MLQDISLYPLDVELLSPEASLAGRAVVTPNTPGESSLTLPSLWWAEQQYGGKLLEHWIAYTGEDGAPRRVDLVVNRQLWGLRTYLERYRFLSQFGTAALQYGYSSRLFNRRGELLGAYLCRPLSPTEMLPTGISPTGTLPTGTPDSTPEGQLPPLVCQVYLDAAGMQPSRGPFGF